MERPDYYLRCPGCGRMFKTKTASHSHNLNQHRQACCPDNSDSPQLAYGLDADKAYRCQVSKRGYDQNHDEALQQRADNRKKKAYEWVVGRKGYSDDFDDGEIIDHVNMAKPAGQVAETTCPHPACRGCAHCISPATHGAWARAQAQHGRLTRMG